MGSESSTLENTQSDDIDLKEDTYMGSESSTPENTQSDNIDSQPSESSSEHHDSSTKDESSQSSKVKKINNYHVGTPKYQDPDYVYPDMIGLVPKLGEYCKSESNDYHCKNLYKVMFRAANDSKHNGDRYYSATDEISSVGADRDISYHMKTMMYHKEHPVTIIHTCHEFREACDKLANPNPSDTPESETLNLSDTPESETSNPDS
ncbi:Hypothetical protein HVR_LOCUS551 [uncultured virus]|nr:Hypothetical protein HVR_LOCUS551 [uncultured virus]